MTRFPLSVCRTSLLAAIAAVGVSGPGRAEEPFDYFRNSYSVIGLKDYARGARVTPDNQVLLDKKQMVHVRFGRQLTSLSRKHTKTLLDGWMPIVLMS